MVTSISRLPAARDGRRNIGSGTGARRWLRTNPATMRAQVA